MKKLIYADDLQAQLSRKKPEVCRERYIEGFNDALMRFKSMIHSAKAVDAVPVVRCKECKHAYINSFSVEAGVSLCRLLAKRAEGIQIVMQPDDFCSYAERRDNGDG